MILVVFHIANIIPYLVKFSMFNSLVQALVGIDYDVETKKSPKLSGLTHAKSTIHPGDASGQLMQHLRNPNGCRFHHHVFKPSGICNLFGQHKRKKEFWRILYW